MKGPSRSFQAGLSSGNPDKGFAEVPARQHVDESARSRLQALADILAVADVAGSDEGTQFREDIDRKSVV